MKQPTPRNETTLGKSYLAQTKMPKKREEVTAQDKVDRVLKKHCIAERQSSTNLLAKAGREQSLYVILMWPHWGPVFSSEGY